MRKTVIVIAMVVCVVASTLFASISSGSASTKSCNTKYARNYSPTWGSVTTLTRNDRHHAVTLRFRLSDKQLRILDCIANYLEIDLELKDSGLNAWWESYLLDTNLPGGLKDTSDQDIGNPRPAVTNIHVNQMMANYTYHVTLKWDSYVPPKKVQYVRVWWAPSHWGAAWTPEGVVCFLNKNDPKWCLFGNESVGVRMWECFSQHRAKKAGFPSGIMTTTRSIGSATIIRVPIVETI
jgi:hypothetical protein